jgi:TctA family transporter
MHQRLFISIYSLAASAYLASLLVSDINNIMAKLRLDHSKRSYIHFLTCMFLLVLWTFTGFTPAQAIKAKKSSSGFLTG